MTAPDLVFLFGSLTHGPLREAVLGPVPTEPARVAGHSRVAAEDGWSAALSPSSDGTVEGLAVPASAAGGLGYYAAVRNWSGLSLEVETASGPAQALAYQAAPEAGPWDETTWLNRRAMAATRAAHEVMWWADRALPETVAKRYGTILSRSASWVTAQSDPMPAEFRSELTDRDVECADHRQPYAHYFSLEEVDVRFARFNGGQSELVERAVFLSGDAAVVLPYDPVRDRVLLVEQFRAGPYLRGDPRPWLMEPIAGRIDPGETPEETARREAVEEAGLTLNSLSRVASFYASSGAVSEYVYCFLATADLPDGTAGIAGVEAEAEDIRSHLLSFGDLMRMLETGEADNGPLVVCALALARDRDKLRGRA